MYAEVAGISNIAINEANTMSNQSMRADHLPSSGVVEDSDNTLLTTYSTSLEGPQSAVLHGLSNDAYPALMNNYLHEAPLGLAMCLSQFTSSAPGFINVFPENDHQRLHTSYADTAVHITPSVLSSRPGSRQHDGTSFECLERGDHCSLDRPPEVLHNHFVGESVTSTGSLMDQSTLNRYLQVYMGFYQSTSMPASILQFWGPEEQYGSSVQSSSMNLNTLVAPHSEHEGQWHVSTVLDSTNQASLEQQEGHATVFGSQTHPPHFYLAVSGMNMQPNVPKSQETSFQANSAEGLELLAPGVLESPAPCDVSHVNNVSKGPSPPSKEAWNAIKDTIERIWLKKQHTTKELIKELADVHGFHATGKTLQLRYNRWGFHKNRTKNHAGHQKDQTTGCPRRRVTKSRKRKAKHLYFASKFEYNPVPSDIGVNSRLSRYHEKMYDALRRLVDNFLGQRRWTSDAQGIILVPRTGIEDNSRLWQALTYQCHSIATLSKTQLYEKLHTCLDRLVSYVDKVTEHCDINFLIYFWPICVELNAILLPKKLKSQTFILLRIFLKRMEMSFMLNRRSHSIIDFLQSLQYVMREGSRPEFRYYLDTAYILVIKLFSKLLGNGHAVVMSMQRHHSSRFRARNNPGLEPSQLNLAIPYKTVLNRAESRYGCLGQHTIAVLYDYASAMSVQNVDLPWLELLQKRTAKLCREQTAPKCDLISRAYVFSTELLADELFRKDRSRSITLLEDAIEVLRYGDQDCQTWSAYCSKKLVLWHKTESIRKKKSTSSPSNELLVKEKARMVAIRSNIKGYAGLRAGVPFSRCKRSDRIKRRKACDKFQSSVRDGLLCL